MFIVSGFAPLFTFGVCTRRCWCIYFDHIYVLRFIFELYFDNAFIYSVSCKCPGNGFSPVASLYPYAVIWSIVNFTSSNPNIEWRHLLDESQDFLHRISGEWISCLSFHPRRSTHNLWSAYQYMQSNPGSSFWDITVIILTYIL